MTRSSFQVPRSLGLAALLALVAALIVPASSSPAVADDCPAPVPVAELVDRLGAGEVITGTGYTVVRGGVPEPFDVEVLGVQRHFFLPGRYIILVQADSPAIRDVGGVWAGMSGSPVYDTGGRLIGGLAWGFSAGPSKLAGLTPAQEMLDLLAYPPGGGPEGEPTEVLSGTLAPALAAKARARDPGAGARVELLPLPVPITNPRAVGFAQQHFDDRGLPLLAVSSGGATAGVGAGFATPVPGGNFAAAFSFGDNAYYASGTTSLVCGGYAVAFAHFMDAVGPASLGGNDGHTITVVDDPTLTPYKLMNLSTPFGTVDQDRFAGVRARLGVSPPTASIRTSLRDLDNARQTTGATDVAARDLFPFISAMHLWDAIDGTIDRWGAGTSTLRWTVTGSRQGGAPWSFTRENMFASGWDIGYESFIELHEMLSVLQGNDVETVSFGGVEIDGGFEQQVRRSSLGAVSVSVDGGPPVPAASGLVVEPGAALDVEVGLVGRESPAATVSLSLRVPDDAEGFGSLRVHGGATGYYEDYNGVPADGDGIESFDDLLAKLGALPPHNSVVAELSVSDFEEWSTDGLLGAGPDAGDRDQAAVDRVVTGERWFELFVQWDGENGNGGERPAPAFRRVAGQDRIDTAIAVSQRTRPNPEPGGTVVLARADDYADALAGAPLAAKLDAPLLLSRRETVPPAVAEEIARLGASQVVVLGGKAALTGAVETQLTRAGLEIERVGGRDRFDTARLIGQRVGGSRAYLALGAHADPARGWPDALAVSALAATQQRPILLTLGGSVPEATRAALRELDVSRLTLVGGTAAIGHEVENSLRSSRLTTSRLAGRTRYETSYAIAQRAVDEGADGGRIWFVTGRNYPDALSAGPAAAYDGGVLLLVDGVRFDRTDPVWRWLGAREGDIETLTIVGGRMAISDQVGQSIKAYLPIAD